MTPQLRFPEFTDDWQVKKLGDVLSIGSGRDYKHLNKGDMPVYGTGGLMTWVDDYLYDGKSVAIGRKGTIDQPQFLTGKFWTVDTLFYTHDYKNSVPEFVFSLFQNINWKKWNEASGVPSLSSSTIKSIKVTIPSKPEQEKIADFLTAVDERIAVGEKKLELLETYKRGVMQKIFSKQIRFKDEDGKPYPDWEEKKLGEIGETYSGLTGKSGIDFGVGANFITYMQIFSSSKISQNFGKVRINPNERQNTVKYGDIFFTTSSETPEETGYTSVLLDSPVDTYLNSFCFGYRADKKILSPEFARYLFHSSSVRSSIVRLAQGSTRYNISKIQLMKMKLAIPSFEEQQKIATFLTALDEKITAEKSKLTATRQFKKALLQRMFV